MEYTFIDTESHAYLIVRMDELLSLNLGDHISEYSYTNGTYVYLEEDVDAVKFISQYKIKNGYPLDWKHKYVSFEEWDNNIKPTLKRFIANPISEIVGYGVAND